MHRRLDMTGRLCHKRNGTYPSRYTTFQLHTSLLNDQTRTESFIQAIKQTVATDDIVVDIGTGLGILAIAAIQAGARKVSAIEQTSIAHIAKSLPFSQIETIANNSFEISLEEKADVLITETIGRNPLENGILEVINDAKTRLLKKNARIIPRKLKIWGIPTYIPNISDYTITAENVAKWKKWYGIDFSAAHQTASITPHYFYHYPQKMQDWTFLGEPFLLANINFMEVFENHIFNQECLIKIQQSGHLNGIVMFFEAILSQNTTITTNPQIIKNDNSWACPVWCLPSGFKVGRTNEIPAIYNYSENGIINEINLFHSACDCTRRKG